MTHHVSPIPASAVNRNTPTDARVVNIAPELAQALLERNYSNRALSEEQVKQFARDMAAGKWRLNGDTIKIAVDGQVLDGQHRLYAVIESGSTIQAYIVEGLDPSVMPTIDTGKKRSFADVLTIGGEKNTTIASSVYRWLGWYFQNPRPATIRGGSFTHSELTEVMQQHTDVAERVKEISSSRAKKANVAPISIIAFVYTLAYRMDAERAIEWLDRLGSGAGLEIDHPIYQFRERMIQNKSSRAKLPPTDIAALAIKSWNCFLRNERKRVLSWKSTEPFPTVERPVASLTPRRRTANG